jgi:ribonuclease R
LFCRLSELPVEGLVHVTSLADDFYYLESGTHTLVGRRSGRRHRLGDREIVRIAHIDVDKRALDLVLSDSPVSRGRQGKAARSGAASTGRADAPRPPGHRPGRSDTGAPTELERNNQGRPGPRKKKGPAKAKKSGKKKRRGR